MCVSSLSKAGIFILKESLLSLLRRSSCFVLPQLHARILKSRHSQHPFLLAYAYLASDNLPPPVFLWNETIKGRSRNGRFREVVDVYDRMLARGVRPDEFTFTFVLPACADARSASEGRRVHGNVLSFGCGSNVFVATALVDMYGKCGDVSWRGRCLTECPCEVPRPLTL
ncbi:hypothetical protein BHE74_00024530 [Ensete ventricosum]|nr:hypothetical protein BHE74_00024530 [Ensete ventricosum]